MVNAFIKHLLISIIVILNVPVLFFIAYFSLSLKIITFLFFNILYFGFFNFLRAQVRDTNLCTLFEVILYRFNIYVFQELSSRGLFVKQHITLSKLHSTMTTSNISVNI